MSQAACNAKSGNDRPVAGNSNFRQPFRVHVCWPLDDNGDQNVNQNSCASITPTEPATQAAYNPFFSCPAVRNSQGQLGRASKSDPRPAPPRPGCAVSSGSDTYPTVGTGPKVDAMATGTGWPSSTAGSKLMPFFGPDSA